MKDTENERETKREGCRKTFSVTMTFWFTRSERQREKQRKRAREGTVIH